MSARFRAHVGAGSAGGGESERGLLAKRSPQLQDVVGRADQQPLASVLEKAPERHLTDTAGGFDLSEDRLDSGLSSSVRSVPARRLEKRTHHLLGGCVVLDEIRFLVGKTI